MSGDEDHRRSKEHERERSRHQDSSSEDDYSQEEESWLPVWHKSSKNKCCWILSSLSFNLLTFAGSLPPAKRDLVLHELSLLDLDIILLQETHVSNKSQPDEISKKWPGNCFWFIGTGNKAGVAMFVFPRLQGKTSNFLFDSDG